MSTTVYLVYGTDPSSVYHMTRDCPALTSRTGWLASVAKAKLNADGTQTLAPGHFGRKTHRRRPCKRCAR